MDKSGKPLPPNPYIAKHLVMKARQLPAAKSFPPKRIALTVAEREVFLNTKKIASSVNYPVDYETSRSELEAACATCGTVAAAHELLDQSKKICEMSEYTSENLFEAKSLAPHITVLSQRTLSLTEHWQQEIIEVYKELLEMPSRLHTLLRTSDETLALADIYATHAGAITLRRTLLKNMSLKNYSFKCLKLGLKELLDPASHKIEFLTSTQKIKEKILKFNEPRRGQFIAQAIHVFEDHHEEYSALNEAVRKIQAILNLSVIPAFDISQRIHFISYLKRAQKVQKDLIENPLFIVTTAIYTKQVFDADINQIIAMRKVYPFSIQFRLSEPIKTTDTKHTSSILYFFSAQKNPDQEKLKEEVSPTSLFIIKTVTGHCVTKQDLTVKSLTETLWQANGKYYFMNHIKDDTLYEVDAVAALAFPCQQSTNTEIKP